MGVSVGRRQVLGERCKAKLDLSVGELNRYGVLVAGVQESKLFRKDVWPAADDTPFFTLEDPSQRVW